MSDDAANDDETEAAAPAEAAPEMYGVPSSEASGQLVLFPSIEAYVATVEAMKADGYVSVIDLCGADYLTNDSRKLPAGVAPGNTSKRVGTVGSETGTCTRSRARRGGV